MIGAPLRLETPEGIDLELRPAGPAPRGLAMVIDATITQTAVTAVGIGFLLTGEAGLGLYLVLLFVVEWFYPVLFEVLRDGQTPGKRVVGLRVVNGDATPIGWSASIVRNLLRSADFFPLFYMGGLTSMLLSQRFQRLGDLAAETLVVHTHIDPAASPVTAEMDSIARDLGARTAPVPLSSADQRALLDFADRREELSVERAIELSDILEPITDARGEAGLRESLRIANGIAGRA